MQIYAPEKISLENEIKFLNWNNLMVLSCIYGHQSRLVSSKLLDVGKKNTKLWEEIKYWNGTKELKRE